MKPLLNRWLTKTRESFVYLPNTVGHHGQIGIVHLSFLQNSANFVGIVEKALLLIGTVHPRGYRRINQEIRYIVNTSLPASMGQYDRSLQSCDIDFKNFEIYVSEQKEEWGVALLACLMIHETTHGYLVSRGIPYNEKTKVRVERLCVREEERFAARLPSTVYDPRTLVIPFDESRWHYSWYTSRWKTGKKLFSRLLREYKEYQDKKKRDAL